MGGADGRMVAITGSTNGIGAAAAAALATEGFTVIQLARDAGRAEAVRATVEALTGDPHRAPHISCDLASFSSVNAASAELCERFPRVDALICNAGLIDERRTLTEDGFERTLQVNHLSHFLLVHLMRPALLADSPSRVIVVSSDAHFASYRGFNFADPGLAHGWSPFKAYAQSKLANIMFAYELAERWAGTGVSANAVHPGVVKSGFGGQGWGLAGRLWEAVVPKITPEQGADTVVWLTSSPDIEGGTGGYYLRRKPKRSSRPTYDGAARRRLWDFSERATGIDGSPE